MWAGLHKLLHGTCSIGLMAAAVAIGVRTNQSADIETNSSNNELTASHDNFSYRCQRKTLQEAINKSRELIKHYKEETGAPGFVIGVSIDGQMIWEEGIGFSDLENKISCSPNTVMRIASISKSITMAAVAKIWEEGKLDLDKPVQDYVSSFPEKTHEGEKVVITTRHLVSHLSGIRHYKKGKEKDLNNNAKANNEDENLQISDFKDMKEYYLKETFSSVTDSLKLFKDDPLLFKPGTSFLYTTHGWTLVSAVVESVVKTPFEKYIAQLLQEFGMQHTYLDVNEKLIFNRARFYVKNKKGHVENAPYVDNSYKWAGGGILSTVGDLVRFGNLMLYSYQHKVPKSHGDSDQFPEKSSKHKSSQNLNSQEECISTAGVRCSISDLLPGFLRSDTVKKMWTPVHLAKSNYGMGWLVCNPKKEFEFGEVKRHVMAHTGGAIGGSSVLLIMPQQNKRVQGENVCPPNGIVVSILTNLQEVSLYKQALEIAQNFDEIH